MDNPLRATGLNDWLIDLDADERQLISSINSKASGDVPKCWLETNSCRNFWPLGKLSKGKPSPGSSIPPVIHHHHRMWLGIAMEQMTRRSHREILTLILSTIDSDIGVWGVWGIVRGTPYPSFTGIKP